MTYREAIVLGESILRKADIVDAKTDSWLLLAMACKIDHTYYYMHTTNSHIFPVIVISTEALHSLITAPSI